MKRLFILTSALALTLTTTAQAVEETSWGHVKTHVIHAADGTTYMALSPQALLNAGKITSDPADGRSVSGTFDDDGGDLELDENNGSGPGDDLEIELEIPEDALDDDVTITMTVYGHTLSTLIIAFQPSGLVFNEAAELVIKLGWDLVDVDLDDLQVAHEHDGNNDGDYDDAEDWEEAAEIDDIDELDDEVKIEIVVPGFSKYSSGGGD